MGAGWGVIDGGGGLGGGGGLPSSTGTSWSRPPSDNAPPTPDIPAYATQFVLECYEWEREAERTGRVVVVDARMRSGAQFRTFRDALAYIQQDGLSPDRPWIIQYMNGLQWPEHASLSMAFRDMTPVGLDFGGLVVRGSAPYTWVVRPYAYYLGMYDSRPAWLYATDHHSGSAHACSGVEGAGIYYKNLVIDCPYGDAPWAHDVLGIRSYLRQDEYEYVMEVLDGHTNAGSIGHLLDPEYDTYGDESWDYGQGMSGNAHGMMMGYPVSVWSPSAGRHHGGRVLVENCTVFVPDHNVGGALTPHMSDSLGIVLRESPGLIYVRNCRFTRDSRRRYIAHEGYDNASKRTRMHYHGCYPSGCAIAHINIHDNPTWVIMENCDIEVTNTPNVVDTYAGIDWNAADSERAAEHHELVYIKGCRFKFKSGFVYNMNTAALGLFSWFLPEPAAGYSSMYVIRDSVIEMTEECLEEYREANGTYEGTSVRVVSHSGGSDTPVTAWPGVVFLVGFRSCNDSALDAAVEYGQNCCPGIYIDNVTIRLDVRETMRRYADEGVVDYLKDSIALLVVGWAAPVEVNNGTVPNEAGSTYTHVKQVPVSVAGPVVFRDVTVAVTGAGLATPQTDSDTIKWPDLWEARDVYFV